MIAVADSRCRHFGSSFWVILLRRSRTSFRGVVPFCRSVVLVRRSVELFCCVVVTCLASFRCVAELCHPVLSFHRVIPLRRSTAFLFQRLGRLDCIGSVALGNVGMRWEVGTSSIARQGGYYALEFDGKLTAIHVGGLAHVSSGGLARMPDAGLAFTPSIHLVRARDHRR
jgi:hypothetical protein